MNPGPRSSRARVRAVALVTLQLAASLTFATTAALAGPSPVLLGTAGDFAVLAGSGMTNTGNTTIVGDVGSSPTHTQSGFTPCPGGNCVNLTGANHDVADPNDAATQQAKSDLVVAYNDAFGRTGGTAITSPLGGGMTLVAGVYASATDIFVGGDLTLDAGGDPDAVFIFQAKTSTLTTAAGITSGIPNTRVLLANGAQACNVFWQVGSSATISTYTQFVGTILAHQSITVATMATLDTGRALARNGAVTLDTNTIKKATCATQSGGGSGTGTGTTPTAPTPTPTPAGSAGPTAPVATASPSPTSIPSAASQPQPGSAQLSEPVQLADGRFVVSVTGRAIELVTFYIDGKAVRTVRAKRGRRAFRFAVETRGQSRRVHRLTARVRFTKRSGTAAKRLRMTYRGTSTSVTGVPRFTG